MVSACVRESARRAMRCAREDDGWDAHDPCVMMPMASVIGGDAGQRLVTRVPRGFRGAIYANINIRTARSPWRALGWS